MDLDLVNTVLGILASVFSIIATIVSLQNKSEIKKLRDSYDGNRQVARGNGNTQVVGRGNMVSNDGR